MWFNARDEFVERELIGHLARVDIRHAHTLVKSSADQMLAIDMPLHIFDRC